MKLGTYHQGGVKGVYKDTDEYRSRCWDQKDFCRHFSSAFWAGSMLKEVERLLGEDMREYMERKADESVMRLLWEYLFLLRRLQSLNEAAEELGELWNQRAWDSHKED